MGGRERSEKNKVSQLDEAQSRILCPTIPPSKAKYNSSNVVIMSKMEKNIKMKTKHKFKKNMTRGKSKTRKYGIN